jgi:hypothetical protein
MLKFGFLLHKMRTIPFSTPRMNRKPSADCLAQAGYVWMVAIQMLLIYLCTKQLFNWCWMNWIDLCSLALFPLHFFFFFFWGGSWGAGDWTSDLELYHWAAPWTPHFPFSEYAACCWRLPSSSLVCVFLSSAPTYSHLKSPGHLDHDEEDFSSSYCGSPGDVIIAINGAGCGRWGFSPRLSF